MSIPWVSVITVVKDDPAGFAATLASVREQTGVLVEHVVVDGSRDPAAIPGLLTGGQCTYRWSEPRGIYAAMNEALTLGQGEYAYFANAGDTLAAADVLQRAHLGIGGRDWGFGPVSIIERDGTHVVTPRWDYARERAAGFARGLFPAHQGTFARRELLLDLGGFDTTFAIAADYAMALRLAQHSDPAELDFVIATFREGGTSTVRWQESFREFHRARREIWQPTGLAAWREQTDSLLHFGRVWLNRTVLSPLRGPRS